MASNAENVSIWWRHHDSESCFMSWRRHALVDSLRFVQCFIHAVSIWIMLSCVIYVHIASRTDLSGWLFMRSRECYFGVYCPSYEGIGQIKTKITLVWVLKQFITKGHTLSYFLHNITTIKITISTQQPRVSLARFNSDDDVPVDCWWRHKIHNATQ